MGDRLRAGKPSRYVTSHLGQLSLLSLRTLNADLHPLNHGLNSAWRLAQDRERWRQLVETATLQPGARSW